MSHSREMSHVCELLLLVLVWNGMLTGINGLNTGLCMITFHWIWLMDHGWCMMKDRRWLRSSEWHSYNVAAAVKQWDDFIFGFFLGHLLVPDLEDDDMEEEIEGIHGGMNDA